MYQFRYEEDWIVSDNEPRLHVWRLPSQKFENGKSVSADTQAVVLQLHGNAENLTSHYRSLAWISLEGMELISFDYRGYGRSDGKSEIHGTFKDAQRSIEFAKARAKSLNVPLIVYGQSLGGSLALRALSEEPDLAQLRLTVIESAFASYQQIVNEKLASFWITWPFQWIAYPLIASKYDPITANLNNIPGIKLLIYSTQDPVIPAHHGDQLFKALPEPKMIWKHDNYGHVNSMFVENGRYRTSLIELIKTKTIMNNN